MMCKDIRSMLYNLKLINACIKYNYIKRNTTPRFSSRYMTDYSYRLIDADSKSSVVTGWCSCFTNKNKIYAMSKDTKAQNRKENIIYI